MGISAPRGAYLSLPNYCYSRKAVEKSRKTFYLNVYNEISMPRIPENLRERALGMLEAECTTAEVAARVGASVQSIRSLRWRFAQTGSTRDLLRSGRPRVTSRAQDRYILNQHLRDRFRTATATAAVTPRYSQQPYFRQDSKESPS